MTTTDLEGLFWAGLRPQTMLTVSEWADQNRILDARSSSEPGEWRTDRVPYLREIMDALGPGGPEEIVVKKASQLGFTEAGNNWIGYCIEHMPSPMLYVQPTEWQVRRYSKQRVAPMIEASPSLSALVAPARTRDSGNTVLLKEFPGGFLSMVGANSARGLASMPARCVFGDEMDGYPGDVDKEGDPVEIMRARTETFSRNRKMYFPSTPTELGFSRVSKRYDESDQRLYFLACPECNHRAPLFFRGFLEAIPEHHLALNPHLLLEDAPEMLCQECGGLTNELAKTKMLMGGEWRPTSVAEDSGLRGYKISGLYSPAGWKSWERILVDWRRAKAGGPMKLKTFVNTVLGEAWQQPGEEISAEPLMARMEDYDAELPDGVLLLTAGVDVQADRLEIEVVGWGAGDESWSIAYEKIYGNTNHGAVWERLLDYLERDWKHELGFTMRTRPVCIDSGYRPKRVYDFVKPREHREIFATKGRAGLADLPIVTPSTRRLGKTKLRKVTLWIVGTDEGKSTLMDSLTVEEPGPGYCHFPLDRDNYDQEHFLQLTAERRVIEASGKSVWKKLRERNEALDCRVYAIAAREIRRPDYVRLERRAQALAKKAAAKKKDGPTQKTPRRVSARGRGRSGGWMSGGGRG